MEHGEKMNAILQWLLERYMENPNATWNIAGCHGGHINDVYETGRLLTRKGFVKHGEFHEDGYSCTITMLGISKVSDLLLEVKYRVLEGSIEKKKRSIMEILDLDEHHFRRGFDYAAYLKKLGIIECIFQQNDVLTEPTFYGREWFEENRTRLIN